MKMKHCIEPIHSAPSGSAEPKHPEFHINLTLSVTDPEALWIAAAGRLLDVPEATLEDVYELIGPREDPSISDCIVVMAKPHSFAGVAMDDFWIENLRDRYQQIAGTIHKTFPDNPPGDHGPHKALPTRRSRAGRSLFAVATLNVDSQPN